MKIRGVAYLAGPYRAKNGRTVRQNIRNAEAIAIKWWRAGFAVICPHLNTAFFDGEADDAVWLEGDLELIRRVDLVIAMHTHQESAGTQDELTLAASLGKKIVFLNEAGDEIMKGREA